MNFVIYDIALLVIFVVCISIFLYRKRKNLKKEGLLFLYRTKVGMRIIDKIGTKYTKLLGVLGYVSIAWGFVLMIGMLYLFIKIMRSYVFQAEFVKLVKVPPIMPIIPYIDKVVPHLNLPSFYFIYFVIIIAIIAITHEFAHGIFMRRYGIKIKSTGFGFFPFFLPIFPLAFVEQDEKSMEEKKIMPQMAVLSAGTFANTLTAILFFGILIIFFSLAFSPGGIAFNSYTYSIVNISQITSVNGVLVNNPTMDELSNLITNTSFNDIEAGGRNFVGVRQVSSYGLISLYEDAPAINANLSNIIVKINGEDVISVEKLTEELLKYKPGDEVIITTLEDDAFMDHEIILGENPENENLPYLGIAIINSESSGFLGKIAGVILFFKESNVYYKPSFAASEFIYNLLWWLVMISFSIALINMLPVGIFDGGRFFYLTMLTITKSKSKSKKIFSFITALFLFLLLLILIFWVINLIK